MEKRDKNEMTIEVPREESPERDVNTSQEMVSLPRVKMTKAEIMETVTINKRLLLIASIILVSLLVLSVFIFCMIQISIINRNSDLKEEEKRNSVNIYLNILIFVLGVFIPGPFHNIAIKQKKR